MLGRSATYHFKALGYRAILLANWKRHKLSPNLVQQVRQAEEVMFQAQTVFPFVLFPDTITIDRLKVTITERYFFGTAKVTSIPLGDVLNVQATVGPFFGSVKLWSQVFTDRALETTEPIHVSYLSRKDALEIEAILQGSMIAEQKHIDTSTTPKHDLVGLLRRLGKAVSGPR